MTRPLKTDPEVRFLIRITHDMAPTRDLSFHERGPGRDRVWRKWVGSLKRLHRSFVPGRSSTLGRNPPHTPTPSDRELTTVLVQFMKTFRG